MASGGEHTEVGDSRASLLLYRFARRLLLLFGVGRLVGHDAPSATPNSSDR